MNTGRIHSDRASLRRRRRLSWPLIVLAGYQVLPVLGKKWLHRVLVTKRQRTLSIVERLLFFTALPALLFFVWGQSQAADYETAATIRQLAEAQAVSTAAQPGIGLKVEARMDDRVVMPACGHLPESRVHSQSGSAMSVAVECRAPQVWTLYVPVRLEKTAEVVVLSGNLAAGTVIDAMHLDVQSRDISQLAYGYMRSPDEALGMRLRRPLQAGWALSSNDVEAPHVIRRGDTVTLVARSAGIEVRTTGKALSAAGIAEPIRVKNLSTRRLVEGRVTAEGEVRVGH